MNDASRPAGTFSSACSDAGTVNPLNRDHYMRGVGVQYKSLVDYIILLMNLSRGSSLHWNA